MAHLRDRRAARAAPSRATADRRRAARAAALRARAPARAARRHDGRGVCGRAPLPAAAVEAVAAEWDDARFLAFTQVQF